MEEGLVDLVDLDDPHAQHVDRVQVDDVQDEGGTRRVDPLSQSPTSNVNTTITTPEMSLPPGQISPTSTLSTPAT
jgi:hypothetical protein